MFFHLAIVRIPLLLTIACSVLLYTWPEHLMQFSLIFLQFNAIPRLSLVSLFLILSFRVIAPSPKYPHLGNLSYQHVFLAQH